MNSAMSASATIKMQADEPLPEAGRRALRVHYLTMLAAEDGARRGDDPEALHDMRVATRRQRQIFRVVKDYYKRAALRPFRDGLQGLARHLGSVRDFDVLIAAAEAYRRAEPDGGPALDPLLDGWRAQRGAARDDLVLHLDAPEYRAFINDYGAFLAAEGVGLSNGESRERPDPVLVRDVAPEEIWRHYGRVRAYETVVATAPMETLHALRIDGKRLRYVLELFGDALGPQTEDAVEPLVALQDHLGEMHDAHVAISLLQDFLVRGAHDPSQVEAAVPIQRYLTAREVRWRLLRHTLDRPWRRVVRKRYRKLLAELAAGL